MKKNITIKKIAEKAGCSISTVSYALNNHPSISEETKAKILQIKEELGYQPNLYARNLRKHSVSDSISTGNIGFIIVDRRFNDPVYLPLLDTFSKDIQTMNLNPVVLSISPDVSSERDLPLVLRERNLDGFLLTGILNNDKVSFFSSYGIPFVVLGNYSIDSKYFMVRLNTQEGTFQALDYLCSRGHKRIGLISEIFEYDYHKEILRAYRQYFIDKNVPFKDEWIQQSGEVLEGGYRAAEKILSLKEKPTAILVTDLRVACGVVQKFQENNVVVGKEISILSFAGDENISFKPKITKIKIETRGLVSIGLKMLFEKIKNPEIPSYQALLSGQIEEGETCFFCKE